jgi:hypothetical protein
VRAESGESPKQALDPPIISTEMNSYPTRSIWRKLFSFLALLLLLAAGCRNREQAISLEKRIEALERGTGEISRDLNFDRLTALEEKLKKFETEVTTARLSAGQITIANSNTGDAVEVKPWGIYVRSKSAEGNPETISHLSSTELYIQDIEAFKKAPYWNYGRGVRMSLQGPDSGLGPELRFWHKSKELNLSFDRKFNPVVDFGSEVIFNLADIDRNSKSFQGVTYSLGAILFQAVALRDFEGLCSLRLRIASSGSVPLSGVKGKVKYATKLPSGERGAEKSALFVYDGRMNSGTWYPLSVSLEAGRNDLVDGIVIADVEVLGHLFSADER